MKYIGSNTGMVVFGAISDFPRRCLPKHSVRFTFIRLQQASL